MKHTRAFTPYKPSAQMLERVKVISIYLPISPYISPYMMLERVKVRLRVRAS